MDPCFAHHRDYKTELNVSDPECGSSRGQFLILSPGGDKIVPLFGNVFTDEPLPKDGYVSLPDRPGFGVTLNRRGLDLRRPYARYVKQ